MTMKVIMTIINMTNFEILFSDMIFIKEISVIINLVFKVSISKWDEMDDLDLQFLNL